MDPRPTIDLHNYIDGALRPAHDGRTLDVFEPATGRVFARCADSGGADVDAAVAAARNAFPAWSTLPADARAAHLQRIAEAIEARFDEFVACESRDSGKTLAAARSLDIPRAVANLRFFAAAATQFASETHASPDALNYTLRQPLGVVGCISPWNLPLYLLT
ncbi:MAG: aldehyde dehydrogenase family protein, partial [Rudaea sp.]